MGPLAGIKVVELTQFFPGPTCGRLLQSLGAEVLKVEPIGGERGRHLPPRVGDASLAYVFANAGKQVVEVDLTNEAGRVTLHDLIASADVFVENLSLRALHRLGIPREPAGPRQQPGIRCSIRGADPDAEGEAGDRAVDVTVQARSGMMWISGGPGDPRRISIPLVDIATAVFAALGVVAQLLSHDSRSGGSGGCVVEVSMLSVAAFLQGPHLLAQALGLEIAPLDGNNLFVVPNGCFRVGDGHIALAAFDDAAWQRLAAMLSIDAKWHRSLDARLEHREQVNSLLGQALSVLNTKQALALLQRAGIPCARVVSYAEALLEPDISRIIKADPNVPAHSTVIPPIRGI